MDRDTLPTFFEVHEYEGLISLPIVEHAVQASGLSVHEVEEVALASGFLPKRYQRNRKLFSVADHLRLHRSYVALVGCGGLGGYVAEMLARCGVGHLICIDPDCFVEHNLNRQRLCTISSLGRPKVKVIAEALRDINPSTVVFPHVEAFHIDRAADLLGPADIVIDALDSIESRSELAAASRALGRPFVHGAIGGWYGQFGLQAPDSNALHQWLDDSRGKAGIEEQLGNPSFVPPLVAAMQAAATVRILLGREDVEWGKVFFSDLQRMSFDSGIL
jgi:molybdopterin/thiamine biosynthesis adenylyltransferase